MNRHSEFTVAVFVMTALILFILFFIYFCVGRVTAITAHSINV